MESESSTFRWGPIIWQHYFFLDDLRVICDITCISLDSSFILSPGTGMV